MDVYIENMHLRVSDLDSCTAFYRDQLGFVETFAEHGKVGFASSKESQPVLFLSEDRDAGRFPSVPGLYHVAYLYPHRKELARAYKRLYENRWPFQGFADHGVSEALYLADPDGNGIELYADRPRDQWAYENGILQMTTERLDLQELLKELDGEPAGQLHDSGVKIGHIHLQVSDIGKAEKFYHRLVGFDVTQRDYPGALFVSAGGYHHHLGFNIWNSRGATKPADKILGLEQFRISVGSQKSLEELRKRLDETGNVVESKTNSFMSKDFDSIQVEFSVS
ncbi:MAG: glyoxalase family protein [Bacteroidetes bacterium]|nr:glyoxalase family protein [Bacteroidota bacterium]